MDFFTSRNKIKFFSVFSTLLLTTISFPAFAEINNGDTAWILTSTALVLFTTLPGLALFYACLLYTAPSPRDQRGSRMPSSA